MTLLELILFVLPAFTGASDEEDEEEPSDEERPRQRARREEEDEEEDWPGYRSNAEDIYNADGWSPSSPSSSEDEEDSVGGTGDQGPTWEPAHKLKNCAALDAFEARHGGPSRRTV